MTKTYFKAIHSSGTIHLRASVSGRPYAWAIAGKRLAGCASFASKRPGPLKPGDLDNGLEIVPAHTITKEEYATLEKANKNFCSVTFRGKKYTHSDHVDQPRSTHAVCVHRDASEYREVLTPQHHKSYHERHPEGFFMVQVRASTCVWFGSEEDCRSVHVRYQNEHNTGPHAYSVVELVEVKQL